MLRPKELGKPNVGAGVRRRGRDAGDIRHRADGIGTRSSHSRDGRPQVLANHVSEASAHQPLDEALLGRPQ